MLNRAIARVCSLQRQHARDLDGGGALLYQAFSQDAIGRNLSAPARRLIRMTVSTRLLAGARPLLVVGVLVLISACGVRQVSGGPASAPPESVRASQQATTARVATSAERTLSGAIIEGLRPTCRVLQTSGRRYTLSGPLAQHLHQGDRVTVTGVERRNLINPCGLTFVVVSITAEPPGDR